MRKRSPNSLPLPVNKRARISEDLSSTDTGDDTLSFKRPPITKSDTTIVSANYSNIFSVSVGVCSETGERDENQDAYLVDKQYDPQLLLSSSSSQDLTDFSSRRRSIAIFGVFDGHGKLGARASQSAVNLFPDSLFQNLPNMSPLYFKKENIETAITKALNVIQQELVDMASAEKPETREFGTTALISVLWSGERLTIANVGDCRAVLYRFQDKKPLQSKILSRDHNFTRADERERVKGHGGQLSTDNRVVPKNLNKKRIHQEQLALSVSRSLGHYTLRNYGVSHSPEFITKKVKHGDILVCASDGLWGPLTDEVPNIVEKYHQDPEYLANQLTHEVLRRNQTTEKRSDNITVLVVKFIFENSVARNSSSDFSMKRTLTESYGSTTSSPERKHTIVLDSSSDTTEAISSESFL